MARVYWLVEGVRGLYSVWEGCLATLSAPRMAWCILAG